MRLIRRSVGRNEIQSLADAQDMRINGKDILATREREHHVYRLKAYTLKF